MMWFKQFEQQKMKDGSTEMEEFCGRFGKNGG
jgi:hypothetical protein